MVLGSCGSALTVVVSHMHMVVTMVASSIFGSVSFNAGVVTYCDGGCCTTVAIASAESIIGLMNTINSTLLAAFASLARDGSRVRRGHAWIRWGHTMGRRVGISIGWIRVVRPIVIASIASSTSKSIVMRPTRASFAIVVWHRRHVMWRM